MELTIAGVISGGVGNTSDTATGTIIDDDTSLVTIAATDAAAGEPNDDGLFTVSMTNPSDSPTVVAWSIGGSATSGVDYVALSGTVTFAAGSTSQTIDLTVIDDVVVEGPEDVVLTLTAISSGDANVGIDVANDSATANLSDDDSTTWQLAGSTTVNEGANAVYNLDLPQELQAGESVSVDLVISNSSASNGDYASFNTAVATAVASYSGPGALVWDGTTLTFTSNGTGAMAQLPIQLGAINDSIVEGTEDYDVSILNPASTTGASVTTDFRPTTPSTRRFRTPSMRSVRPTTRRIGRSAAPHPKTKGQPRNTRSLLMHRWDLESRPALSSH